MKTLAILIISLTVVLNSLGQKLSDTIVNREDGISIDYFDTQDSSCHSEIFIADNLQIIILCDKRDYKRIDISSAKVEINRIREILTAKFIDSLNQCCSENHCPDTNNAYIFTIKKGNTIKDQYLDFSFIGQGKCDSDKLKELIDLYKLLNQNYH
jgi:hypothetical protein